MYDVWMNLSHLPTISIKLVAHFCFHCPTIFPEIIGLGLFLTATLMYSSSVQKSKLAQIALP